MAGQRPLAGGPRRQVDAARMTAEGRYSIHELQRQDAAERLRAPGSVEVIRHAPLFSHYLHFITHPRQSHSGESSVQETTLVGGHRRGETWRYPGRPDGGNVYRIGDLNPRNRWAVPRFVHLSTPPAQKVPAFRYAHASMRLQHTGRRRTTRSIACASAGAARRAGASALASDRDAAEDLLESIVGARSAPLRRRAGVGPYGGLAWSNPPRLGASAGSQSALFLEAAEPNQEIGDSERYSAPELPYALARHRANRRGLATRS